MIGLIFFTLAGTCCILTLIIAVCFVSGVIIRRDTDIRQFFKWYIFYTVFMAYTFAGVLMAKTKPVLSHSYNIYALEDSSRIKGRRYYIEEEDRYYYLASYRDGKKMYWVDTDYSYIVESDETPRVEVYELKYDGNNMIIGFFHEIYLYDDYAIKEYKIIVPKDTLTDNFNVDLNDWLDVSIWHVLFTYGRIFVGGDTNE